MKIDFLIAKKEDFTPYVLYPGDIMKKDGIRHLPLYMGMFL